MRQNVTCGRARILLFMLQCRINQPKGGHMSDPSARSARPYRSVLYIPASKERALEKAQTLQTDAIIFDLEDAVAPDEKISARDILKNRLQQGGYGKRAQIVWQLMQQWYWRNRRS